MYLALRVFFCKFAVCVQMVKTNATAYSKLRLSIIFIWGEGESLAIIVQQKWFTFLCSSKTLKLIYTGNLQCMLMFLTPALIIMKILSSNTLIFKYDWEPNSCDS